MSKYKVRKGDSGISIANNNNLNLNDLLYGNGINPMSKENLPAINPGQELYTQDPYRLYPSFIQAEAPKDYINFGSKGQQLIDKYALAVKQGAMSFDQVPDVYKTAVYQKGITNRTDKAARNIANIGLNAGAFMIDPIGYTASLGAQKGLAYAADRTSGRNEYNVSDLLGYTPITGRRYALEHPGSAALIDFGSGLAGGVALRNIPNLTRWVVQNGRNAIQNGISTTGLQRQTLRFPTFGKQSFNTIFQEGVKESNKTGTVYAGRLGGYRPVVSPKGFFYNQASGTPTIKGNTTNSSIPFSPVAPISIVPVTGPVPIVPPIEPPIKIPPKEQEHIYEQQSFNYGQRPNPSGIIVPHKPGTGIHTITGHAPIGNTIGEQALTKESINIYNGYKPRVSTYTNGSIEGTPSNIHSGLGIIGDSNNPGNLIIK